MPLVSFDAMREAGIRDAGAKYNDIIYFSTPSDWQFQFTTPNASTRYVYFNLNLADGPVVIDVPAAVGAGLFGSLTDAWQVPGRRCRPGWRGCRQRRQTSGPATRL
jgi:hypothetical protein